MQPLQFDGQSHGSVRHQRTSTEAFRAHGACCLAAAAGVAVPLVTTQPRLLLDAGARAQDAAADTYRQLSLFGDVFERVRADYVEKPDDGKLIESAIYGMLARLDPHVRTRQQPQDGKDHAYQRRSRGRRPAR